VLALLAGTQSTGGTLDVSLTVAPGSHVLDNVQTLRLVITNPHQIQTATRGDNGFTIALDLDATGSSTSLIVDGLDASGAIIATGAADVSRRRLTAKIVIYMAAPNTIGAAPLALAAPRDQIGLAALSYGAVLAGGRDAAGAPSDAIAI